MDVGAILNSDMGTLRVTAARALHWWLAQLEELLPARLRQRQPGPRHVVIWDGDALTFAGKGGASNRMPRAAARVTLAVDPDLAFKRTLQLPRMSAQDLRQLVQLEAERLSPLPALETVVGMQVFGHGDAPGTMSVGAAVLPEGVAQRALDAASEAGLNVASFGLSSPDGRTACYEFMPALRQRGLAAHRRSPATIWWALVAFAFLLNFAVLIIRDQQSVDRLKATVEEQQPAVSAARAIQKRADDFDQSARDLAAQRRTHDVLGALGIVSDDLPGGAWVQRFTFSARTARLTGYRRRDADILAALQHDPRIFLIRQNSAQLVTDTPAGQPFDLSLVVRNAP
jgi:hypothetical protein